jgi:O-methyltransferase involved in polyketide biosynthesis
MIASSVTAPEWLERIPANRTVLIVAEGLTMYLAETDGVALLRRVTERFPAGEMIFDAVLPWGVRDSKYSGFHKTTGVTFDWSIANPAKLEHQVPGLTFLEERSLFHTPDLAKMPLGDRLVAHVMNSTKVLRNALKLLHYRF